MKKLYTVKEFAEKEDTTKQNVYNKINTGSLTVVEKKDTTGRKIKYIEVEEPDEPVIEEPEKEKETEEPKEKEEFNSTTKLLIETFQKQLEEKDKQIASLNNQLSKALEMIENEQKLRGYSLTDGNKKEVVELLKEDKPEVKSNQPQPEVENISYIKCVVDAFKKMIKGN